MSSQLHVVHDPYGALVAAGREAFQTIEISHWRIADLAVQVVEEHRRESETIRECLDRYAADLGTSVARDTIYAYRLTALRWPPETRHEGVSFSAHYEARYHQDALANLLEYYEPHSITSALARSVARDHSYAIRYGEHEIRDEPTHLQVLNVTAVRVLNALGRIPALLEQVTEESQEWEVEQARDRLRAIATAQVAAISIPSELVPDLVEWDRLPTGLHDELDVVDAAIGQMLETIIHAEQGGWQPNPRQGAYLTSRLESARQFLLAIRTGGRE